VAAHNSYFVFFCYNSLQNLVLSFAFIGKVRIGVLACVWHVKAQGLLVIKCVDFMLWRKISLAGLALTVVARSLFLAPWPGGAVVWSQLPPAGIRPHGFRNAQSRALGRRGPGVFQAASLRCSSFPRDVSARRTAQGQAGIPSGPPLV